MYKINKKINHIDQKFDRVYEKEEKIKSMENMKYSHLL